MEKKNIVVLIDWFLPGNKAGGPVKSVYSMLCLLKSQFNFSVITTNRDLGANTPYQTVKSDEWTSFDGIPIYYFSAEKFGANKLAEIINSCHPDIIYLNSFWSFNFSILPLRLKKSGKLNAKVVLAPRGMLGKGALSIKPLKKKIFLASLSFIKLHDDVVFHATTKDEENEIRKYFKYSEIRIASNLNTTAIVKSRTTTKHEGELKLFYLSRISRVKNLHFALEVLKSLKTQATVSYDIYGSIEDETYWNECLEIIKTLPANIKVSYKGELSFDQVQPTILNYHFLFLPTLNENFGHSIAETLKSACPVIISTATPWTNVNQNCCGYAIELTNQNRFVEVLNEAINFTGEQYQKMSENCIKFMEANSNDKKEVDDYKKLFQ